MNGKGENPFGALTAPSRSDVISPAEFNHIQELETEAKRERQRMAALEYVFAQADEERIELRQQVRDLLRVVRTVKSLNDSRPSCYGECETVTAALEPLFEALFALSAESLDEPEESDAEEPFPKLEEVELGKMFRSIEKNAQDYFSMGKMRARKVLSNGTSVEVCFRNRPPKEGT